MSHFVYCNAECHYDECRYTECRYAECQGAISSLQSKDKLVYRIVKVTIGDPAPMG